MLNWVGYPQNLLSWIDIVTFGILITDYIDISTKEFKTEFLRGVERDEIEVIRHGRKRGNKRHIDEETIKDFLTQGNYRLVLKGEYDDFEIHYNHPNKEIEDDIVIIVAPKSKNPKLIRVVTVYIG